MSPRAARRLRLAAAMVALPACALAHADHPEALPPLPAPSPVVPRSDGVTQLVRGPYLQIATQTSVHVRWRTDVPVTGVVRYGPAPNDLPNTASESSARTEHEVTLTSLTPATRVYYAVGEPGLDLAGADAAHFVDTHPAPGSGDRFRIWAIGDSGLPGLHAETVRDAYVDYTGDVHTNVWLMLGDNAYNDGTDAQYQVAVFDMYEDLLMNTVLWPTRGNHDRTHTGAFNDYYELFSLPASGQAGGVPSGTEAYYSFDYANVHFVCLDSFESNRAPNGPMANWLATDLAATTRLWILAYWHHPPYSKGSHDSDTESNLIDMRTNILPILENGGADLVLSGHSHSYERSFLIDGHYGPSGSLDPSMVLDASSGSPFDGGGYVKPTGGIAPHEGTVYTVAGSSSRIGGGSLDHPVMVTSLNELGSLVIDVEGNILAAVFLDDTGDVRDDFVMVKGPPSVDAPSTADVDPMPVTVNPVPAKRLATLSFATRQDGDVRITIHDAAGRLVRVLSSGSKPAGDHTVAWDLEDRQFRRVPPGVYFAFIRSVDDMRTARVIVTK